VLPGKRPLPIRSSARRGSLVPIGIYHAVVLLAAKLLNSPGFRDIIRPVSWNPALLTRVRPFPRKVVMPS